MTDMQWRGKTKDGELANLTLQTDSSYAHNLALKHLNDASALERCCELKFFLNSCNHVFAWSLKCAFDSAAAAMLTSSSIKIARATQVYTICFDWCI